MTPQRPSRPLALTLAIAWLCAVGTARAEPPAGQDAAIAAEVAASLPPAPAFGPAASPAPLPRRWFDRFVDHLDLGTQLRSLHTLRLLSVWDGRHVSVYFGVDHRGMAGLHIQQQDPAHFAALSVHDAPPDVIPPLRAVPLQ